MITISFDECLSTGTKTNWGFREEDFEDRMAFELHLGRWVEVLKAERKLKAQFKTSMRGQ